MATILRTLVLPGRIALSIAKALATAAATHQNKIQLIGYEVANVVLVVHESRKAGYATAGLTLESAAALSFLIGSACIWRFDPKSRPEMLFVGGMALAVGGLFLAAAGYAITGFAVALASLETARGGLAALLDHVETNRRSRVQTRPYHQWISRRATLILKPYIHVINHLFSRKPDLARFVNDRPFLTSTLIKAPLRVEFIGRKLLTGDIIGAGVGISWMILGDGGLALNDPALNARLRRFGSS